MDCIPGETPWAPYRELLLELARSAKATGAALRRGEPAEAQLADLERLAAASERARREVTTREYGEAGKTFADGAEGEEVRKLLEESIAELRTAQEYATVLLRDLNAQLDEAVQGQKGQRAYQASRAGERPSEAG